MISVSAKKNGVTNSCFSAKCWEFKYTVRNILVVDLVQKNTIKKNNIHSTRRLIIGVYGKFRRPQKMMAKSFDQKNTIFLFSTRLHPSDKIERTLDKLSKNQTTHHDVWQKKNSQTHHIFVRSIKSRRHEQKPCLFF